MFVSAWNVLDFISDAGRLGTIQVLDESRHLDEGLAAEVFDPLVPSCIRVRPTGRASDNEVYPVGEGVQGGRVDAVSIEG